MFTIKPKLMGAVSVALLSGSPIYSGKPYNPQDNAETTPPQNVPTRRTATTRIVSETLEEQMIETNGNVSRETISTATTSVTQRTSVTQTSSSEGEQQRASPGSNPENRMPYGTDSKKTR